jgi:hypothetical protein
VAGTVKIASSTLPNAWISRGSPIDQVFPPRATITISEELRVALTFLAFLAVMTIGVFATQAL